MRIIAGEFRGRQLLPPEGDVTRPITDRVKQSLFDILAPYIEGARVYDCFAGTGSMGLECLSRGAAHVTFFESDRSAVSRLQKNIDLLKVGSRSRVVKEDVFRWFGANANQDGVADLIFLDPPYRFLRERPDDLRSLSKTFAASYMAPDALIIFRHDAADALALPPLNLADLRDYGSMRLEFLRR